MWVTIILFRILEFKRLLLTYKTLLLNSIIINQKYNSIFNKSIYLLNKDVIHNILTLHYQTI